MQRCLDLAYLGVGKVSPNPPVGAVLVHSGRIIGEGYHRAFGGPHAEVNAVNSVSQIDRYLIADSTLFVSLEPCCFHGKTPACTDLILRHDIRKVVVACTDPHANVNGQGIDILRQAGIDVRVGLLQEPAEDLLRPFRINKTQGRPYIILKYAVSRNGFIGQKQTPFWITNGLSKRLSHRWRGEIDAIMVGRNTVTVDDPKLTNRLYFGKSPLRIVFGHQFEALSSTHIFDGSTPTLVISDQNVSVKIPNNTEVLKLDQALPEGLSVMLQTLYADYQVGILLVEGGKMLLDTFLKAALWDEARIFTGRQNILQQGMRSPDLYAASAKAFTLRDDQLNLYFHKC